MKTAMQELMDELAKKADDLPDTLDANVAYLIFQECYDMAKSMLEKEKEQIIEGYAHGHNDGCRYMTNEKQEFIHAEQYYKETYEQ
jgi:hypothetical protein